MNWLDPPAHRHDAAPVSPSPDPGASLRAVERAIGELRRGDPVLVGAPPGPAVLALAAELATPPQLDRLRALAGAEPAVVLSIERAAALGLGPGSNGPDSAALLVRTAGRLTAEQARTLAGRPPAERPAAAAHATVPLDAGEVMAATVELAKLAQLLPSAVVVPVEPGQVAALPARADLLTVGHLDILQYRQRAAATLTRVTDARVPLAGAEDTRLMAFRPAGGGREHLAIQIGSPPTDRPVLVRLHSECFTGDLLGSLRCDCGDQLRGAVAEIARQGSGVLLYLAQEGRGIGLINKLRAYRLQDADIDTIDANRVLGFAADERLYAPAAEMLRQLGIGRVRLMTNNPDKVAQLIRHGIEVVERVPHAFPSNGHNHAYLATKRLRAGHLL